MVKRADLFAEHGSVFINDTTDTSGNFMAAVFLLDTTVTTLEMNGCTTESKAQVALTAGTVIYGHITRIVIEAGGLVQMINRPFNTLG